MLVEVTATNSFGVSRPVSTPLVQSTASRSSSPPVPFGIDGKSLQPHALLLGREGAWSVATTCSDPAASPAQRLS